MKLFAAIACGALLSFPAAATATDLAPLDVPAKALPAPTADISPEMQALVGAPLNPNWNKLWKTGEEARAFANARAANTVKTIPAMLERLHVKSEASTIDGVRVHILTPDEIPPENKDKVLIHLHGGCYVLSPGESGTTEGIIMAGDGRYKVISVDYRMPPEAYFPAAVDDAVTVYKAVLKDTPAKNIGVFGTSAGGALTLELVLRAREQGLPAPGALAAGTPMADATKTGDSFYTNEKVDNVLVSRDGFCDAATVIYAHGHDLKDPLISPVYGDMHGFPAHYIDHRHSRPLVEQHGSRASQAAAGGRRRSASGLRRRIARPVPSRRHFARKQGSVRGDRIVLWGASRKVAARRN